ncbi:MAG: hypothetical protein WCJ76_01015 [Comamonadaceae bacterium]
MTESQFVRNQEPHEVTMPEGSHIAKSKSADPGAPVVRQLQLESDPLQIAQIIVDRKVQLPPPAAEPTLAVPNFMPVIAEAVDVLAALPVQEQSVNEEKAEQEPEADSSERLIHLRIENNKVRAELKDLEQIFNSGL